MESDKNCRLCGNKNTQIFLSSFNMHGRHVIDRNDRFELRKCLNCECLFISDVEINSRYYEKYYEPNYYSTEKDLGILSRIWSFVYTLLFNKKERFILRHFKNRRGPLSILDIGCGDGKFLSSLNSKNFDKNGIEINPQGIRLCRKRGIRVYEQPIELLDFGEKKFDVITLWHVLEHLESPKALFKKIPEILNPKGILVFQVPNNKSLGLRFGRESWFHLDSPRHLIIPNKKSLAKILQENEMEIIKIKNEFYDYPLDLLWSVRKSLMQILIIPFYPIFKIFSQEHLTFICRKKDIKKSSKND